VWFDDDVVEVRIKVSNGISAFANDVYATHLTLTETIAGLNRFREQIHGGILDVCFGAFGPEYAKGAFHARFHFARVGKLYVTCRQESDFAEFGVKIVASRCAMYFETEPILLDDFIGEFGCAVRRSPR
jgi:hypothetical protein